MTVLEFNKEAEKLEPLIWRCDCGNCSFLIFENGQLECAACGTDHSNVTEHYQTIRKWTRKVNEENE